MNVFRNKNTRALILTMCALVFIGLTITYFYYQGINKSIDPRITNARKLYENYNNFTQNSSLDSVISLMDTIESIYSEIDHYTNSFEAGVLYNNRAAALMTRAIHSENINNTEKDSLLINAKNEIETGISIYQNWLKMFEDKTPDEIKNLIENNFYTGLENYTEKERRAYLDSRIDEIIDAQKETPRRLSVSYTNLGIIYRQNSVYDSAAQCYIKAVELWDRNLTAENNLNMLLGKPLKKRNIIQKLFPPDKDK